jgi:hypothetical protein
MEHQAPAIFVALEQSGFAAAIRQSIWIYPFANVGHIVFLTIFAGAIAIMDVRLIGGFAATHPAAVIERARRVVILALCGLAFTGFLLFSAEASHVVVNPVFLAKLGLIAAGIVNVTIYQFGVRAEVLKLAPNTPMPPAARRAAYTSIAIWILVAACGRTIAYL